MKIGKYQIVGGPNGHFYVALAIFAFLSYDMHSWRPMIFFAAIIGLSIPLSLWLHGVDQRQGKKMLEDFPYDPVIQQKYGKYKD